MLDAPSAAFTDLDSLHPSGWSPVYDRVTCLRHLVGFTTQQCGLARLTVPQETSNEDGTFSIVGEARVALAGAWYSWVVETGIWVTDSPQLDEDAFTLHAGRARGNSSKTDDHGEIGVSPGLVALLATTRRTRAGKVFPWRDRHGVYRWLRPLCAALGVTYTPHLSRHALATDLRALGWDMKAIAERGVWRDERSAGRYTHHRTTDTPGRSIGILRNGTHK